MTRTRQLILALYNAQITEDEELNKLFDAVNTHEALTDRDPLPRDLALTILDAIPQGTPFIVVFETVKDDVREMLCIRNEDAIQERPTNTYPVWDREKEAVRAFRLDHIYKIEVSGR